MQLIPIPDRRLDGMRRRIVNIEWPLSPADARKAWRLASQDLPELLDAYEELEMVANMLNVASTLQRRASREHAARLGERIDELVDAQRGEPFRERCGDIDQPGGPECYPDEGVSHRCTRPAGHTEGDHECPRCGSGWIRPGEPGYEETMIEFESELEAMRRAKEDGDSAAT